MISLAVQDRSQDPPTIKSFQCEVCRQGIEESRVGRRIGIAKVVDGFHNPAAHHLAPESIHFHASKEWVLRVCEPICQNSSAIGINSNIELTNTRQPRLHRPASSWLCYVSGLRDRDKEFVTACCGVALNAIKEGPQAIVVILGPSFVWVIVTLGAFQSGSQKDLCG